MSVLVGLVSDVHASVGPLQEALGIFQRHGVAAMLCAGDIAGYGYELEETIELLKENRVLTVRGNHDEWYLARPGEKSEQAGRYLAGLPERWKGEYGGTRMYMVHGSPPDSTMQGIRLLDEQGRFLQQEKSRWVKSLERIPAEVLVVGHTHQVFAEEIGSTLIVNPGSTKFNHSCATLRLPEREVHFFPLSGKRVIPSWNWGMMFQGKAAGEDI